MEGAGGTKEAGASGEVSVTLPKPSFRAIAKILTAHSHKADKKQRALLHRGPTVASHKPCRGCWLQQEDQPMGSLWAAILKGPMSHATFPRSYQPPAARYLLQIQLYPGLCYFLNPPHLPVSDPGPA